MYNKVKKGEIVQRIHLFFILNNKSLIYCFNQSKHMTSLIASGNKRFVKLKSNQTETTNMYQVQNLTDGSIESLEFYSMKSTIDLARYVSSILLLDRFLNTD